MTIGQLISILEKYGLSTDVLLDGYEYGFCDVIDKNIRLIKYSKDIQQGAWGGPHEEAFDDDEEAVCSGVVIGRG